MKINGEIIIGDIPIRFLPECGQGLKTWLTTHNRELNTMNDLTAEQATKRASNSNWHSWWLSPSAGSNLATILIKYRHINTEIMEIDIPRKYESLVNIDRFVVE